MYPQQNQTGTHMFVHIYYLFILCFCKYLKMKIKTYVAQDEHVSQMSDGSRVTGTGTDAGCVRR